MASDPNDDRQLVDQLRRTAEAIGMLAADRGSFQAVLDAYRKGDGDAYRAGLERLGLLDHRHLVCDWICSKEIVLRCFELCGPPPRDVRTIPDIREFADVVAGLTADEDYLKGLVGAVESRDAKAYQRLIEERQLLRFCHLICHWILQVHCGLACDLVSDQPERRDLFTELRQAGEAVAKLAANPEALDRFAKLALANDCPGLHRVIAGIGLSGSCSLLCLWWCSWRCIFACWPLCRAFPIDKLDTSDDEIFAFAETTRLFTERPDVLAKLVAAIRRQDAERFGAIVKELKLERYCVQLCHWLCYLSCHRFCICVCPPLIGEIDKPDGGCAEAVAIEACIVDGGPLVGIVISGTAGGGGFDHYTLRYSYGGPPVQTAVVYPDCSRPPGNPSYGFPVAGGILGYLDVTLLPPGVTEFTVYLDVFDSGAGQVSDTATFQIKTTAVEITAVAKVDALNGEDPFNAGTFTKLIKAVSDPSPAVPEQSIGGAFSVDGSAYLIGCDRIMSQFILVRFDAPPAAPVPSPPNGDLGLPIITAVPYEDTPNHPWQSGCFPVITPNTILNGDLVAFWSKVQCTFLGSTYTRDKVKAIPFWNSAPLNGRFLIFLDVKDRPLPGGSFPGTFAAKDQVAVWIDNQTPTAVITSIGGISGCGDLHLKDYVGTTAEIRGIAWDPPIDPSAPQLRPNENFGSYSLSYKKNGELTPFGIPGTTPNTRVPNIWPGPIPAGTDGQLASWDIIGDLDYVGPGPTPLGKLARGERCAYVINLGVTDTTHVGDGGNNNTAGPFAYAINIINDIP
jgi:hypothetical protein